LSSAVALLFALPQLACQLQLAALATRRGKFEREVSCTAQLTAQALANQLQLESWNRSLFYTRAADSPSFPCSSTLVQHRPAAMFTVPIAQATYCANPDLVEGCIKICAAADVSAIGE